MSDELKHECAVAMVVLRKPVPAEAGDFGGAKLSLLLEKQHNRGQDGAGAAILSAHPEPGESPYWLYKSASATPLVDLLAAIGKRPESFRRKERKERKDGENGFADSASFAAEYNERVFLGHLRYATFGKNDAAFCYPFVHQASELEHTLLLAGNFNLTNTSDLFETYSRQGEFPTSKADGYLLCEMIAKELTGGDFSHVERVDRVENSPCSPRSTRPNNPIAAALSKVLPQLDGAWTLCGMTGDGWAFATRDPFGIRPGYCLVNDDVVVVASERPAIQAAFNVSPEAVTELPPGSALLVSPSGEVVFSTLDHRMSNVACPQTVKPSNRQTVKPAQRSCAFERIYFSRANDADIHRERKALGAALLPQILKAADAPLEDIFFSYIPNSARIAFHGLLEELFSWFVSHKEHREHKDEYLCGLCDLCGKQIPRFGEIAVKDAKFRTFIADAAARSEFYKHVYDVTYGLVRPGRDTLVVLDDSIVRGNTMRNAILPMLDRLGPRRIVIASSAPPIRYPDCYGIDMSTLGELVAFRALVNLLGPNAEIELNATLAEMSQTFFSSTGLTGFTRLESENNPVNPVNPVKTNPLASLYARFTDEEHCAEIARLLTPPGMKAEVKVVFQTVPALRATLAASRKSNVESRKSGEAQPSTIQPFNLSTCSDGVSDAIGDWYFTGEYPTPGGYKVLRKALQNYLDCKTERSY